ncbi:unnamed protein product [Blepharisma stoltei]|uniref:Uncharacterized protein n=1 Tax=Blepharisma stoltei TaxID=1481888 RepID=A0AAU9J5Y8_9CILI|nr:unnamed protein product [Blepharisma stoltei]
MRSKSMPRAFHRTLIEQAQTNLSNVPTDIFYRFMKELPYKLLPQSTSYNTKVPAYRRPPIQHCHIEKHYEKIAQSSPSFKKQMLLEARFHSKNNSLYEEDLPTEKRFCHSTTPEPRSMSVMREGTNTMIGKSNDVVLFALNQMKKEKENTSGLLKQCQEKFSDKISLDLTSLNKTFRRKHFFTDEYKKKAVFDYKSIQNKIQAIGKTKTGIKLCGSKRSIPLGIQNL